MNFKRFFAFLLALMMALLCFVGCETAPEEESSRLESSVSDTVSETEPIPTVLFDYSEEQPSVTPLFWKVTGENGEIMWLFGSIHVGMDSYYPLPKSIEAAFNSSDAIAFEIDMIELSNDMSAAMEAVMALLYVDGTTISDHISPDLYERAVKILEENSLYSSVYDVYMPVMWMTLISNICYEKAELDSDLGIDMQLLAEAKNVGKTVLEVESAKFQYDLLGGFSPELQEILLESTVLSYELGTDVSEIESLAKAWARGDEAELTELAIPAVEDADEFGTSEEEIALFEEYYNGMYRDRNVGMTDFCVESLESGEEVFLCVGLAHFLGEDGIIAQLRARGYTVEEID